MGNLIIIIKKCNTLDSVLHKKPYFRHIVILAAIFVAGITGDFVLDHSHYGAGYHRKLQKQLVRKFRQIDKYYEYVRETNWQLNAQIPVDKGIMLLAYQNDSLIYWSDNNISFASFNNKSLEQKRFEFISNGWYVIREYQSDSIRVFGFS